MASAAGVSLISQALGHSGDDNFTLLSRLTAAEIDNVLFARARTFGRRVLSAHYTKRGITV